MHNKKMLKKCTKTGISGLILTIIGLIGTLIINFASAVMHKLFIKGSMLYVVQGFELLLVIGIILLIITIYRILKYVDSKIEQMEQLNDIITHFKKN
jgi:hypothetical protein